MKKNIKNKAFFITICLSLIFSNKIFTLAKENITENKINIDNNLNQNIDNNILLQTNEKKINDYKIASNNISKYKPISLDSFLYLTEDKEVSLYKDIPEKTPPYWANESIYYFKALGIYKDTENFYPDKPVTYGQFKIILQKLLGLENSNLEEYGLLSGINNIYEDSYILKREDVAFIIGNVIKAYNIELPTKSIALKENVSKFALNNFQFLVNLEIIKGDGKSYNPKKQVTKAELSVILYNLTNLYAK